MSSKDKRHTPESCGLLIRLFASDGLPTVGVEYQFAIANGENSVRQNVLDADCGLIGIFVSCLVNV